jgi:hypothetical protein
MAAFAAALTRCQRRRPGRAVGVSAFAVRSRLLSIERAINSDRGGAPLMSESVATVVAGFRDRDRREADCLALPSPRGAGSGVALMTRVRRSLLRAALTARVR